MRAGGHPVHLLHRIGAADGPPARQRRQRAVVVAAAIAQPVAAGVPGQQGHQQRIGHARLAVRRNRAEAVREQRIARTPAAEGQRLAAGRGGRQQDGVAAAGQGVQQGTDVDLGSHRPKSRDGLPGHGQQPFQDAAGQQVTGQAGAEGRVAGVAGGQHGGTEGALGVHGVMLPPPDNGGARPWPYAGIPGPGNCRACRSLTVRTGGAALAVGVSPSQGLLAQVGAGYHDHDHGSASSRESAYWPWG